MSALAQLRFCFWNSPHYNLGLIPASSENLPVMVKFANQSIEFESQSTDTISIVLKQISSNILMIFIVFIELTDFEWHLHIFPTMFSNQNCFSFEVFTKFNCYYLCLISQLPRISLQWCVHDITVTQNRFRTANVVAIIIISVKFWVWKGDLRTLADTSKWKVFTLESKFWLELKYWLNQAPETLRIMNTFIPIQSKTTKCIPLSTGK